ncbi:hypothetical protein EON83_10090 [bacterium]|nr:MAG: hypothetical protein EON83_10090 [bacterium]
MFNQSQSRLSYCFGLLMFSSAVSSCHSQTAATPVTVSSLAELRAVASKPNQRVTLKAGDYWLESNGSNPFLDLSGANSSFNFANCHIRVDSRQLKGFGRGHENTARILQMSGENVTVDGLKLSVEVVDGEESVADMSTNTVEIIGSGDVLRNCEITTRGSRPYGSGDAFGKGARPANGNQPDGTPFFEHSKNCGVRVGKGAGNVTIEGVTLHVRAFGHGIFFQEGSHDITVRNCTVEAGPLASSNDVIADPLYQQYGKTTYGQKINPDIRLSKSEDGIRVYGPTGVYGAVKNIRIENCRVLRMRDAYAMVDVEGTLEIKNCEAWNCETGFTPARVGNTSIVGCKGDALNGPLLFFRRGGNNVSAQIELTGDEAPVGLWPIAIISGTNNKVTLTRSGKSKYPDNAFIMVSQAWREWRHRTATNIDSDKGVLPTTGLVLDNKTGIGVVLGTKANNSTVESNAPVLDKGANNTIKAPTKKTDVLRFEDTWGQYQLYPAL